MKKSTMRITAFMTAALVIGGQNAFAAGISRNIGFTGVADVTDFEATFTQNKQRMFVTADANVLSDTSSVASSVERVTKGTEVYVLGTQGEMCSVLTSSGKTGYLSIKVLSDGSDDIFEDTQYTAYCMEGTDVLLRPSEDSAVYTELTRNTELTVTGVNHTGYARVEIDGETYYVSSSDLSESKIYVTKEYPLWNGPVLTPGSGTIVGPSGKETYYNLDMSVCVRNAIATGAEGEYWVREDGVKMLGDYVMVAADYSIRPRGTILPTSLGMGIVVDTGSFILSNQYQIDIAVAW